MSPPTSEGVKSPASPAALSAQQETTSSVGIETISSTSPNFLVDQQQTPRPSSAIKESTASLSSEASIHHPQSSGPPSSMEDQLRTQIAGLEDNIRRLKLNEDPTQKHQALESEHHKYKKQMKKFLEKAMKNLSTGLDLSKGGSTDPGLTTEGVVPDASLPPQQSVSDPMVEKISGTPSAFQFGVTGSTGASLPLQPNTFSQPSATVTCPSFLGPLGGNKPFSSMFGDPKGTIQPEAQPVLVSTPGFCNNQEQSFEEARLRRYELHNDNTAPSWKPDWSEVFGSFKAPAPQKSFGGASSSSKGFSKKGKKGKNRKEGGRRERQPPGSIGTAGANNGGSFKPTKLEGDETASMTPANNNTGED